MTLSTKLGKVLIANRGEIACRVIRTAKKLGVKTVAVYSDADVDSMHVSMSDEAYNIGPPPAQESYLKGKKIIEVARKSRALAIHPGYGFLSENADFATLCQESGIIFIGPPASAIRDMGIKNTSKEIMMAAGVSVIPGYHGGDQSDEKLKEEAKIMGFPLMIKAVRGGGGKGMRIVMEESEFQSSLDSARRESLRAFGDDAVLLEKYIARPRHIEVQVFGDSMGNYVHLFERDCSIQRRHQKVLEQAPAPGIGEMLRSELGEAAVRAAKAVNYIGAGTVEFIMDIDTNKFYFMEMNTRLQVEHPVTEMITGLDLVEWQLRIASGESIPLRQEQIKMRGHSVEARIYAEDVYKDFLPTAGYLENLSIPFSPEVRVETGVTKGDSVSVHYDPMIAKLVAWDMDSQGALQKLEYGLQQFNIVGVENNVNFLRTLCKNIDIQKGKVHTGFISDNRNILTKEPSSLLLAKVTIGVIINEEFSVKTDSVESADPLSPYALGKSFRLNQVFSRNLKLKHQDKEYGINVSYEHDGSFCIKVKEDAAMRIKSRFIKENDFFLISLDCTEFLTSSKVCIKGNDIYIFDKDGDFHMSLVDDLDWVSGENFSKESTQAVSPMPGVVEKIFVKVGDLVKKGEPVAVVMAMKMEHVIKADHDGIVSAVLFNAGSNIGKNIPLVKFKE